MKGTINRMPSIPEHAKPARRDLLWALAAILACGLLEVWASWLQIGAVSGFPKLGRMTTGWILPVTNEFYWIAALQAWLVDPAGPRSRRFAMWSAAGVFALSVAGQESDHLLAAAGGKVPPSGVIAFVTALPLLSVALIAILIHLRQKDREEAAEVARAEAEAAAYRAAEAAAADDRAGLRAEVAALRESLEASGAAAVTARAEYEAAVSAAEARAAEADAKAETAARKLAAALAAKRTGKAPAKKPEAASRIIPPEKRKQMVRDLFDADPSISIKAAADELGWSRDTVSPILTEIQNEANIRPMERRQA